MFTTAVAGQVAVFRRSFLRDLTILLEFPRLCTAIAIVIYGVLLDAGDFSANVTFLLDISQAALSISTKTFAGDEESVTPSATATEGGRD